MLVVYGPVSATEAAHACALYRSMLKWTWWSNYSTASAK